MREKFNHLYLDNHERKLLLHSLIDLKNQLIQQGRYTDCEYSGRFYTSIPEIGNRRSDVKETALPF